ncbi:MAG: prephenate dehydratase [Pirellulaceae bacterium]|nr:prephenate dehydratase [Pirellulaceae bacterium]
MAKKTPPKEVSRTKKGAAGASNTSNLDVLKREIRRIDDRIVRDLNERADLIGNIAKIDSPDGVLRLLDKEFRDMPAWVDQNNPGPLSHTAVCAVFRELLGGCRVLLKTTRVAHLGPMYSYSHLAAIQRFGQSAELVPVGTIAAVFEEVHSGQSDMGLVPIENSTDGRVADTLDMFTRVPVRICGEVELPIHHALLAKCERQEVREVYSKPQALSQCRNWLARHVPGARAVEVTSTSMAAELAAEKPGVAAIASRQAGIQFGLNVLAEKIEDNPHNVTRFSIIGKQSAPKTGKDKTAIMFQLEDRPGVLAEALNIFKRNRVNLTWIESFPIPGAARAYWFFVEMEGHESDLTVRRATASLSKKTLCMSVLGSFAVTVPVE